MNAWRMLLLIAGIYTIAAVAAYELRHPAQCHEVVSIRIANMVMGGC